MRRCVADASDAQILAAVRQAVREAKAQRNRRYSIALATAAVDPDTDVIAVETAVPHKKPQNALVVGVHARRGAPHGSNRYLTVKGQAVVDFLLQEADIRMMGRGGKKFTIGFGTSNRRQGKEETKIPLAVQRVELVDVWPEEEHEGNAHSGQRRLHGTVLWSATAMSVCFCRNVVGYAAATLSRSVRSSVVGLLPPAPSAQSMPPAQNST